MFVRREQVGEGASTGRKGGDPDDHDHDAEYLLSRVVSADVTVAHRREGGHDEVKRGQVLLRLLHAGDVLVDPGRLVGLSQLREEDPDAGELVADHERDD